MKTKVVFIVVAMITLLFISCCQNKNQSDMKIIFLHHSTGEIIWNGRQASLVAKIAKRINNKLAETVSPKAQLPLLFKKYNEENNKNYLIKKLIFPKAKPYGWNNFPYDYYNIWVKNAGKDTFMGEPTLEILSDDYQVVIFKHCFPVCYIEADIDSSDINSDKKTLSNYKLQYTALRDKLHEFPDKKFILFTGAALTKSSVTEDKASRARDFFEWVTNDWDLPGDNIYLWDLYKLQTEGGLYFKDDYAVSANNSHPNDKFAGKISELLFNRIIDIIENDGNGTRLTGEMK